MKLVLPAYAKINLGLRIIGKRDDGYHELETVLHQVNLGDTIEIQSVAGSMLRFECDDAALPADESNLCVRAALLMREKFGVRQGARIRLSKRIPYGAGLGGGSSDAAVLLGLNRLWMLGLEVPVLQTLAAKLGSDVPFFILGGSALARGRGEIVEHFDFTHDYHIAIVYPGLKIATSWAYSQVKMGLTKTKKYLTLARFNDRNYNNVDFLGSLQNDFEAVVFPHYDVLVRLKRVMFEHGAVMVGMSGSGSAMFAFFSHKSEVKGLRQALRDRYFIFDGRHVTWGASQLI
jgi:4-diphosphocytidyl-2-C-methyl-D-erythritol kinase